MARLPNLQGKGGKPPIEETIRHGPHNISWFLATWFFFKINGLFEWSVAATFLGFNLSL